MFQVWIGGKLIESCKEVFQPLGRFINRLISVFSLFGDQLLFQGPHYAPNISPPARVRLQAYVRLIFVERLHLPIQSLIELSQPEMGLGLHWV